MLARLSNQAGLSWACHLTSIAKRCHYYIRLNKEFRSDMLWWRIFANGSSMIIHGSSKGYSLFSDVSGSWGCGAWFNTKWFQLQWDERTEGAHIAIKEIIPIIIAAVLWGHQWKGGRVLAHCDNTTVVAVINSATAKTTGSCKC